MSVKDTEKNPILDPVTVSYDPDGGTEFSSVASADSVNGKAVIYIPARDNNGNFKNKVTLQGTLKTTFGTLTVEKEFTEEGYGAINIENGNLVCEETELVFDLTTHTINFHDPKKSQEEDQEGGQDKPKNMPDPVIFYASVGGTIPAQTPYKTGRIFMGWTTNPKAETAEEKYAPGSLVKPDADLDLYAVWAFDAGNSYAVVYNANGGTGAPVADICPLSEDCRISSVIPVKEKCTFQGWSTVPVWDGSAPVYQPGDVYKDRTTVILYALWQADPVYAAKVTYNVNGGDPATAPAAHFVKANAYSYLSTAVPGWDDKHTFIGWSLSPKSLHANYYPGNLAYFEGDTVFYAVWSLDPYKIIEGAGSVWTRGSGEELRFRADGALDLFRVLIIDETAVDGSAYTLSSGSTVAELTAKYLETLESGPHSIRFCFEDGDSDTVEFTVRDPDPEPPVTGDEGHPLVWLLCGLTGIIGFAWIVFDRRFRA